MKPQTRLGIIVLIVLVYVAYATVRSVGRSLIFSPQGRVTMLYYRDNPKIVSIGRDGGVNYELYFDAQKRVLVPGGYGRYRIEALGKLAQIEKNPKLITRAFSSMISAHVDYNMSDVSTIPLLDRLYLHFLLLKQTKSNFIDLNTGFADPASPQDYSENSFQKRYKGFFYEKRLRREGKNVSIVYHNYESVKTLSRIIEGEGIRVVDVSYIEKPAEKCYIIDSTKLSATSRYLSAMYGCSIKSGSVAGADIQMVLGTKLEGVWE